MAVDTFLQIEGIKGESSDDKHPKWIEISSFSWGASQPVSTTSASGGRTSERVTISDLSVSKSVDSSSPHLMLACCTGKHFPKVKLHVNEASENKHLYLDLELEDVIVSSYSPSGISGGDKVQESLSLNFGKITWNYTPLEHNGKPGEKVGPVGWNLEKNVKI